MDVADRLAAIRATIPSGVKLVAVSKFHPVEALREAYDAGQRLFGESRAQEIAAKYGQMPSDVEWHFIGHLQTNKVRQIIPCVSMIHSVDSVKLLNCIDAEARRAGRTVDVLLQLHVAQEVTKSGMTPDECVELAEAGSFSGLMNVRVRGVMGMATFTDDLDQVSGEFRSIRRTFLRLQSGYFAGDDNFSEISMGMSDDYRVAIDEGSTLVRIGTSIFGPRQY